MYSYSIVDAAYIYALHEAPIPGHESNWEQAWDLRSTVTE